MSGEQARARIDQQVIAHCTSIAELKALAECWETLTSKMLTTAHFMSQEPMTVFEVGKKLELHDSGFRDVFAALAVAVAEAEGKGTSTSSNSRSKSSESLSESTEEWLAEKHSVHEILKQAFFLQKANLDELAKVENKHKKSQKEYQRLQRANATRKENTEKSLRKCFPWSLIQKQEPRICPKGIA